LKTPANAYVESRLRVAMGTFVAIDAQACDPMVAERGIAAAFEAIAAVERLMHPDRAGSDLAALASCPPGTPLTVHAWTWEVLELCQRLNRLSRGGFDPCLDAAPGRMTDLEFTGPEVVLPHSRLRVDLGGIAKGYAVDRAIDALRSAGCEGGLVNAGGDLAVFGARRHAIICRGSSGAAAVIELTNAALATSHAEQSSRPPEHRGYYHGVDRTARISGRATVMAERAAVADALTKCLLLGERTLSRRLLEVFAAKRVEYP
jgi:thiamine biosynthesis lipoprotein